jgi:hypothetical protein
MLEAVSSAVSAAAVAYASTAMHPITTEDICFLGPCIGVIRHTTEARVVQDNVRGIGQSED